MIARSGACTRDTLALLASHAVQPTDLLVTVLGVNDVTAQRTPEQLVEDYSRLLDAVAMQAGARLALINGVPPMHIITAMPQPLHW